MDIDIDELVKNLESMQRENETLHKILTADAGLAGAVQEIQRLTAENNALRERNDALIAEKNAAIRAASLAKAALNKATKVKS